MNFVPRAYAEVTGLITMLQVACEDADINKTLETLLSQPDEYRRTFLKDLLVRLREKQAQTELIDAMACLLDDAVAERAYQEIYRCSRDSR